MSMFFHSRGNLSTPQWNRISDYGVSLVLENIVNIESPRCPCTSMFTVTWVLSGFSYRKGNYRVSMSQVYLHWSVPSKNGIRPNRFFVTTVRLWIVHCTSCHDLKLNFNLRVRNPRPQTIGNGYPCFVFGTGISLMSDEHVCYICGPQGPFLTCRTLDQNLYSRPQVLGTNLGPNLPSFFCRYFP